MRHRFIEPHRPVIRISAFCLIVVLAALPLFGQPAPRAASPRLPTTLSTLQVMKASNGYQPLEPGQRFFYALNGLSAGALEVRYIVNGKLHLTEVVDLSNLILPEKKSCGESEQLNAGPRPVTPGLLGDEARDFGGSPRTQIGKTGNAPQIRGEFMDKGRMLELLATHPDEVRELHRLAAEGASINVEIYHSGNRIESLSFDALVRRSADARAAVLVPVQAASDVRGSGLIKKSLAIKKTDYLPDCQQCTWDTPCSTECGYDPGKGGPVTCGEWGVCTPTCQSETPWGQYYSNWYFIGAGDTGYGQCFVTQIDNRWHNEYVRVYRRDLIQQTRHCPSAPSCDGCYITEQVIGYQYLYIYCYYRTPYYCSPAYMPFCDQLCSVDGFTICQ
jgi:hypothetical protein